MIIDPAIERTEPEPEPGSRDDDSQADAILQAEANATLEQWLQDHPGVGASSKRQSAPTFTFRNSKSARAEPSRHKGPPSTGIRSC